MRLFKKKCKEKFESVEVNVNNFFKEHLQASFLRIDVFPNKKAIFTIHNHDGKKFKMFIAGGWLVKK